MSCIKKIYLKYKEIILYLIFGILSTLINILVFLIFNNVFNINYIISNIFAWIFAVLFAFLTNKFFVFESTNDNKKDDIKETFSFFLARIFSLGVDMLFMYVTIDIFSWNSSISKILSNIIVIIINYFFSKFLIFKKEIN